MDAKIWQLQSLASSSWPPTPLASIAWTLTVRNSYFDSPLIRKLFSSGFPYLFRTLPVLRYLYDACLRCLCLISVRFLFLGGSTGWGGTWRTSMIRFFSASPSSIFRLCDHINLICMAYRQLEKNGWMGFLMPGGGKTRRIQEQTIAYYSQIPNKREGRGFSYGGEGAW